MIARVEYPRLDAGPYLDQLDAIGREAQARGSATRRRRPPSAPPRRRPRSVRAGDGAQRVPLRRAALRRQRRHYEDPAQQLPERSARSPHRHSDHAGAASTWKWRGAPGCTSKASTSPGTFCCAVRRGAALPRRDDLIIDAVPRRRAAVARTLCRERLRRHAGGEDPALASNRRLLAHATKPQILARMLLNLKRVYVRMHSFPQARDVTELLLAVDPSAINELRDRGLLAYHLKDFPARCAICRPTCSSPDPRRSTRTTARSTRRSGSTSRRSAPGRFAQLRLPLQIADSDSDR